MNTTFPLQQANAFTPVFRKSLWCGTQVLTDTAHHISVYTTVHDLPPIWEQFASETVWQRPFLHAIEQCPPQGVRPVYVIIYEQREAIGIAYCQLLDFNAGESISFAPIQASDCLFTKVGKHFKYFVAQRIGFHGLVNGNLLLTGEYGYKFAKHVAPTRQISLLEESIETARTLLVERLAIDIKLTLFKEFFEPTIAHTDAFRKSACTEFKVEPNMVLDFAENWETFDDYMAAMSSKYRVRTKRTFKKLDKLTCRDLEYIELAQLETEMHDLYNAVLSSAQFNLIELQPAYFTTLKKNLQADFVVKGYFEGEKLVGFCTAIRNDTELEAHFLGLNEAYNHSHALYHNMLYELIRIGFDWQVKRILFARTAHEIKSSVGAVPKEMYLYMRHSCKISNSLLKSLFVYLQPTPTDWQQRHPFKEE